MGRCPRGVDDAARKQRSDRPLRSPRLPHRHRTGTYRETPRFQTRLKPWSKQDGPGIPPTHLAPATTHTARISTATADRRLKGVIRFRSLTRCRAQNRGCSPATPANLLGPYRRWGAARRFCFALTQGWGAASRDNRPNHLTLRQRARPTSEAEAGSEDRGSAGILKFDSGRPMHWVLVPEMPGPCS